MAAQQGVQTSNTIQHKATANLNSCAMAQQTLTSWQRHIRSVASCTSCGLAASVCYVWGKAGCTTHPSRTFRRPQCTYWAGRENSSNPVGMLNNSLRSFKLASNYYRCCTCAYRLLDGVLDTWWYGEPSPSGYLLYISLPERLHRLPYISLPEGSIDCNTLAYQTGSIDCHTLACQKAP